MKLLEAYNCKFIIFSLSFIISFDGCSQNELSHIDENNCNKNLVDNFDYIHRLENEKYTALWIWYPGDFEIYLSNKIHTQRQQRGVIMPPVWPMYAPFPNISFKKVIDLNKEETIRLKVDGDYFFKIGNYIQYEKKESYLLPKGKYEISVTIYNGKTLPSFWLQGSTIFSDSSWTVTCFDKRYLPVGYWNLNNPEVPPSKFKLERTPIECKIIEKNSDHLIADFGKVTFGYLNISGISGNGKLNIFYGESLPEAMSETAENIDFVELKNCSDTTLTNSRAFRYVRIKHEDFVKINNINAVYEYLPLKLSGSFSCSDSLINEIWRVSDYTFRLTSREFFIDGIKRDRWVWSGDAIQSYLMNYYTYNNNDIVKRTIRALRGKEPMHVHINTIIDYSFYWIISLYEYWLYSGDTSFIEEIYPKAESLMQFIKKRINNNGYIEKQTGDWAFIDWTAYNMPKEGELSFEQLLYYKSLDIFATFSKISGNLNKSNKYSLNAEILLEKINNDFLTNDSIYAHRRFNGKLDQTIYKQPNILAIYYNIVSNKNIEKTIKNNVLLNPDIPEITTPYMKFYELSALAKLNEHEIVLNKMRTYWGGMIKEGATTFWETYDPTQKGEEHFKANRPGRPFSKSLCHNWGASPLYILGRYFLGVRPTEPGFNKYIVEPQLGDLKWIKGKVPLNGGIIDIYMDKKILKIKTDKLGGTCRFYSKKEQNKKHYTKINKNYYELKINEKDKEYIIKLN